MKVRYFPDTDTLYIEISEAPSEESEEVTDGVVVDYDSNGKVVGIEIEHFTEKFRDKPADIPLKLAPV